MLRSFEATEGVDPGHLVCLHVIGCHTLITLVSQSRSLLRKQSHTFSPVNVLTFVLM